MRCEKIRLHESNQLIKTKRLNSFLSSQLNNLNPFFQSFFNLFLFQVCFQTVFLSNLNSLLQQLIGISNKIIIMDLCCRYSQQSSDKKRANCKKQEKKRKFSVRSGQWRENQQAKYYAFLKRYSSKFFILQDRIHFRVFKALSLFVKTRNSDQCRSHHHKIHKKKSSIFETLSFLEEKYPSLKDKSKKYEQKLEKQEKYFFGILQQDNIQQKGSPSQKQAEICKSQDKQEGVYQKTSVAYENFDPQKKAQFIVNQKSVEQMFFLQKKTAGQLLSDKKTEEKLRLNLDAKILECNTLFWAWYQKLSSLLENQGN